MLTLKRRAGERIVIGNDIVIEVRGVGSKAAWIAIHAPKEVPVMREEVILKSVGIKTAQHEEGGATND